MPERFDDDQLQEILARALRSVDPVPPEVHEAAVAAFELRDLDGELAELVDEPATVVRAARAPQLVFATDEIEIAVEVVDGRLVGLLAPAAPCRGAVHTSDGHTIDLEADDLGRFSVAVPGGPLRVVLDHPDGRIRTDWFRADPS